MLFKSPGKETRAVLNGDASPKWSLRGFYRPRIAHRIVSLREQRRPAGGIRGGEPGGEIDADAENAAKTDERRVHGDVNERGAVVERERERDARERDWDRWWVDLPRRRLGFAFSLLSSRVKYSVQKKVSNGIIYFRFRFVFFLSPPLSS